MRTLLYPLAVVALAGCTGSRATAPSPSAPPAAAASAPHALAFIQDDYGAALEVARQKRLPLFVDIWAPW